MAEELRFGTMNITYNQNYLFPAFYVNPSPNSYTDNINGFNSFYGTQFPTMAAQTAGFEPMPSFPVEDQGNVENDDIHNSKAIPSFHRISPTVPQLDVKPLTKADHMTRTACVFQETSRLPNDDGCDRISLSKGARETENSCNYAQKPCSLSPPSPLHKLRLPTIHVTSNMAANVMSEECDLGYCSFTDVCPLPELPEGNTKISANDMLEAQSAFSDIIDEVLDSMDSSTFDNKLSSPLNKSESGPELTDTHAYSGNDTTGFVPYSFQNPFSASYYSFSHFPWYRQLDETAGYTKEIPIKEVEKHELRCDICDKIFQSKASLKVHARMHKGLRPHTCIYCDKSFSQKSTLRTHIRTHTGEKPYTCKYCARAFSDYSTFRKHLRIHTGEKPYSCDVCQRSFTQSGNMIRHREMHYRKEK